MYLLDTNIISEIIKPAPNKGVIDWIKKQKETELFLSVITIGEIKKGIEKKKIEASSSDIIEKLEAWHFSLKKDYADRIININCDIIDIWGTLIANLNGHSIDALIAATAIAHNFTLISRNIKDMKKFNVVQINPFSSINRSLGQV
jgi:predicted nucleic acid-binding protein